MTNFQEIVRERKKLKLYGCMKSPLQDTLTHCEDSAFEIYEKCRRDYTLFKHKNALREAQNIVREIKKLLNWNSPSFNMKKIDALQEYWEEVDNVLFKQEHGR